MMFFELSHAEIGGPNWPWASIVSAPIVVERKCPNCGSEIGRCDGSGWARIDEGHQWADAIGSGSVGPRFLVSERVITALRQANYTGFRAYPIAIPEVKSPALRDMPPPKYFHLCVTGEIDVDLKASGIRSEWMCEVCFAARKRTERRRFIPLPGTWDGADLFQIRNYPSGMVFCSERVLLLAREYRWSNFRFQPMDTVRRHAVGWEGIDYLGAAWPPTRWYPDAPSHGKSLQQWLEILRANRYEAAPVFKALLDFGRDAMPPLLDMLRADGVTDRWNAAEVLWRLRREEGVELDDDTKARIRNALPDLPDSLLR
jgi:hypothetical protein